MKLTREQLPRETVERFARAGKDLPESLDVPLTDRPAFPLSSFRSLGEDGTGTPREGGKIAFEAVPEFFRLLGVGDPPQIDLENGQFPSAAPSLEKRLLRACDIVLHVDRPATATQWTRGAGIDGTVAQFSLSVVTKPAARQTAYLSTTAKWQPLPERGDLIKGDVADSPVDEYLVATVFLLSPRGTQLGSAPDGSWRPFTKHALFWNLRHAMNRPEQLAQQNFTLTTGLAGGAGDPINNAILAQINDANSAAAQFLANGRLASLAWTQ